MTRSGSSRRATRSSAGSHPAPSRSPVSAGRDDHRWLSTTRTARTAKGVRTGGARGAVPRRGGRGPERAGRPVRRGRRVGGDRRRVRRRAAGPAGRQAVQVGRGSGAAGARDERRAARTHRGRTTRHRRGGRGPGEQAAPSRWAARSPSRPASAARATTARPSPPRTTSTTDDEGHFVPPEPPPLPEADITSKFAWLGVLGGPVLLLLAILLGWEMTWWLTTLGIGGFLGGFATLVMRMRTDDEDEDDPGPGRGGLTRPGYAAGHSEGGQHRQVVRGRPQVGLGDPGLAVRDPAAEDLDALGGEDRVDALVRVGGRRGVLARPRARWPSSPGGPAASRRKVRPSGRSFRSPPATACSTPIAGEPVQEQAALRVPLVLLQREMAAQHAEPGARRSGRRRWRGRAGAGPG